MSKSNGPFIEYTFNSWDEFLSNNGYFADDMGFVFRGHGCKNWNLETTLDRLLRTIDPQGIELDSTYEKILTEFIKSLRGRSQINKSIIENENELWALGQHYGLATPLLDWTSSIYVALFFAFENSNVSESGYRSIWAFHNSPTVKEIMKKFNDGKPNKEHFAFIEPISDENPRLITQSGLFTKHPINFNLIDWVKENMEPDAPYLIKINLPDKDRLNILKHLRLMNIHPATLFPEVDGAAKYCNQTLELLTHKRKDQLARNTDKVKELKELLSSLKDSLANEEC